MLQPHVLPRPPRLRPSPLSLPLRLAPLLLALACASKPPPARPTAVPPAPAPAPAPAETAPVFYSLVVESHDLGAEVALNGLPVESVDPADHATLSSGINLWIVPGENRLDIRSTQARGRAGVQHVLRVRISRRDADAARDDVLADFNLVTPDAAATFAETRTFRAEPAPPATLWAHARPLKLDDATRAAGAALVRDLERAFERKDVTAAAALLDWKTVDGARAAFRDPELARATLRESLQGLFEDAGYVVDRLNPETLQFELLAGDRLLGIARPWGAPVQARLSQGGRYSLPVMVANIDGTFRVVR